MGPGGDHAIGWGLECGGLFSTRISFLIKVRISQVVFLSTCCATDYNGGEYIDREDVFCGIRRARFSDDK